MQIQNNFWIYLVAILVISTAIFHLNKPDNFRLRNGDLLFQDLDSSPLCDAIEQVTSGFNNLKFSHVGIVVIVENNTYILEAFSNGVDTIALDQFLNRSLNHKNKPKVVVGRLIKEHSQLIPKAIEAGIRLIGKQYDEEFKINNNKFYCSELIYDIFLKANKNHAVFNLQPMTYKHKGKTLDTWLTYFENLNIPIPENEPGINPGGMSRSKKIDIIYNYMD
ncbi:MAG: hypothetical protein CMP54_03710 [Flavobacteriales bacterium]|nr:hypothetical protein [Flavobacteriales bacterium]